MFDCGFSDPVAEALAYEPTQSAEGAATKEVLPVIAEDQGAEASEAAKEQPVVVDETAAAPEEREKAAEEDDDDQIIATEEARDDAEAPVLEQVSLEDDEKNKEVEMFLEESIMPNPTKEHILSIVKLPNELDFDDGPTELFMALQRKDWEVARRQAQHAPEQACIWISRKEDDGETLRWRLLPLHAAMIFGAPLTVVKALLDAFALGARARDDQGMLPLHLLFRQGGQQEVVALLLQAFPDSVEIENCKGLTPLAIAKASTSPNRDEYVEALSTPVHTSADVVTAAIEEQRVQYESEIAKVKEHNQSSGAQQGENFDTQIMEMFKKHNDEKMIYENEAQEARVTLEEAIVTLETDLVKTQEDSLVLVEHVASLETQLESRGETERFLATRISNLHAFLKDTSKSKEDIEVRLKQEIGQLLEEKLELQKTVSAFNEEKVESNQELADAQSTIVSLEKALVEAKTANTDVITGLKAQLAKMLDEKMALQKSVSSLNTQMEVLEDASKMKVKPEELSKVLDEKLALQAEKAEVKKSLEAAQKTITTLEVDLKSTQDECSKAIKMQVELEAAQAMATKTTETDLKEHLEKEQALCSRVSTLALQLADHMQETSAQKATLSSQMTVMEVERNELCSENQKLTKKLYDAAGFIEEMTGKQQDLIQRVAEQEHEISAAAVENIHTRSLQKSAVEVKAPVVVVVENEEPVVEAKAPAVVVEAKAPVVEVTPVAAEATLAQNSEAPEDEQKIDEKLSEEKMTVAAAAPKELPVHVEEEKKEDDDAMVDPACVSVHTKIARLEQQS